MPYNPYYPGGWQNLQAGNTPVVAAALQTIEQQYAEAVNSLEQDLLTPFVVTGLAPSKDGATPTQLDVSAGTAFLRQSDGTLRRRGTSAITTYSCVGHASATLYLDLNPDGSFSFGPAHSAQANYLPICSLTTDGAANILSISDARQLASTLFAQMSGPLATPPLAPAGQAITGGVGVATIIAQGVISTSDNNVHTLISLTLPATGFYRINAWVRIMNPGGAKVDFRAHYTDGITNSARSQPFICNLNDAGTGLIMDGQSPQSGITFPVAPTVLYCQGGTNLNVQYADSTGSPSDQACVFLERLT